MEITTIITIVRAISIFLFTVGALGTAIIQKGDGNHTTVENILKNLIIIGAIGVIFPLLIS